MSALVHYSQVRGIRPSFTLGEILDQNLNTGQEVEGIALTLSARDLSGAVSEIFTDNADMFPTSDSLYVSAPSENMEVSIRPAAGVRGVAWVYVTVGVNGVFDSTAFKVTTGLEDTVEAVTISNLLDMQASVGRSIGSVSIDVSHPSEQASDISLEYYAADSDILGDGSVIFGGTDTERTMHIVATAEGTTDLYVFATVGGVRATAKLSVEVLANTSTVRPLLSIIPTVTVGEAGSYGPFGFQVESLEYSIDSLRISATSDNQRLIPDANITLSGTGTTRAISFTTERDLQKAVVLEDYAGKPYLYGTTPVSPAGSAAYRLPKGYTMVFAHGRLHMVPVRIPGAEVSGKPYLLSGDILQPWDPGTALQFTETEYLAEGGAHGLPYEMGNIGGLGVLRNVQSSSGLGAVLAFARKGVCAFDFAKPRLTWKSTPISSVLFFGSGCISPWSITNVNNDILYRATDGMRSIRYTTSQTAGGSGILSNNPISNPVNLWLEDDYSALPYVSAMMNDQRFLFTAKGSGTDRFNGIVSWDVRQTPIFDGLWTGDSFAQLVEASRNRKPAGFVFAEGPRLYRLDADAYKDTYVTEAPSLTFYDGVADATMPETSASLIESRIETRAFDMGDPALRKKLEFVELWLSGLVHAVDINVWFRPHGYAKWFSLGERAIPVPDGSLPQARQRVRISLDKFEDFCDPSTGDLPYAAVALQFAVQWTGRAVLERFRVGATPLSEAPPEPCDDSEGVLLSSEDSESGVVLEDLSYSIRGS